MLFQSVVQRLTKIMGICVFHYGICLWALLWPCGSISTLYAQSISEYPSIYELLNFQDRRWYDVESIRQQIEKPSIEAGLLEEWFREFATSTRAVGEFTRFDSDDSSFGCAGTLVEEDVLITAAHCLTRHSDRKVLLFGEIINQFTLVHPFMEGERPANLTPYEAVVLFYDDYLDLAVLMLDYGSSELSDAQNVRRRQLS